MKYSTPLLVSLLCLAPLAASAADTFEGVVSMKLTDDTGTAGTINFSLKQGLTRLDMSEPRSGMSVGIVTNMAKQETTMIMAQQGMHMTQPIPAPAAATPGAANQPAGTMEKTSVTEKILGYDTVKYIYKSGGTTTETWVTEQLGAFPGMNPPSMAGRGGRGGRSMTASTPGMEWADQLSGKPMFPLRVISKGADGKVLTQMEVISVEKKSLPDSVFAPPAGSQDIGAMMRGAIGGALQGGMPGAMPGSTPGAAPRRGN